MNTTTMTLDTTTSTAGEREAFLQQVLAAPAALPMLERLTKNIVDIINANKYRGSGEGWAYAAFDTFGAAMYLQDDCKIDDKEYAVATYLLQRARRIVSNTAANRHGQELLTTLIQHDVLAVINLAARQEEMAFA